MGVNYLRIKRFMDIIITLLFSPIIIPILLLLIIIVIIDDGFPVFFKSKRIGKNCKSFYMYKLRSMKLNSPVVYNDDGSTKVDKNDFRVTKTGKLLREWSLDEFPQFWNVLKGEMSIIGPRASLYEVLDSYTEHEKKKMILRPGITGYSQAYYRNSISVKEKRELDVWYVENVSFLLDLKILFKTIQSILLRRHVYS